MKTTQQEIFDYTQSVRVEYFDDRYYKLQLPDKFNSEKFKYQNLLQITDTGKYIFLPSVTTYLSRIQDSHLIHWRGEVGNEYADYRMRQGADLGSAIHRAIEYRLKSYDVIFQNAKYESVPEQSISQYSKEINSKIYIIDSQDVAVQLARFEKVLELLNNPEIISSEQTVYSLKHLYAGTLDIVIDVKKDVEFTQGRTKTEIKKGKYIVDIKTGKGINETKFFAQLSAYMNAVNVKNIKGALILHLNANIKTGIEGFKPYLKSKSELKEYFKYFLREKDNFLFDIKDFKVTNYDIPVFFNSKLNIKDSLLT